MSVLFFSFGPDLEPTLLITSGSLRGDALPTVALHAPVPNLRGGGWPVMSSSEIASRDHLEIARALSSSGSDCAGSPLVVARGWRAPERVYSLRGYLPVTYARNLRRQSEWPCSWYSARVTVCEGKLSAAA